MRKTSVPFSVIANDALEKPTLKRGGRKRNAFSRIRDAEMAGGGRGGKGG